MNWLFWLVVATLMIATARGRVPGVTEKPKKPSGYTCYYRGREYKSGQYMGRRVKCSWCKCVGGDTVCARLQKKHCMIGSASLLDRKYSYGVAAIASAAAAVLVLAPTAA